MSILRAVLFVYAGAVLFGFLAAALMTPSLSARSDFVSTYTAARLVAAGRGSLIYDFRAQASVQLPLLEAAHAFPERGGTVLPYVAPPFLAIFALPFSLLPLDIAYGAWTGTLFAALAGGMWICLRSLGFQRGDAALGMLLGASYLPSLAALLLGQTPPLLILLLALAARDVLARRSGRAGAWLALGLFKPQYVLVPLLGAAWSRRLRVVAGFALIAFLLVLVSLVVAGPSSARSFVDNVLSVSGVPSSSAVEPQVMQSWRGFFARRLLDASPSLVWPLTAAADVLTLGLLAASWGRGWPADRRGQLLRLSATMIGALLISPHAHVHDAALLVLPGSWFWALARERLAPFKPLLAAIALAHPVGLVAGLVSLATLGDLNVVLMAAALLWVVRESRRVVRVPVLV